MNQVKSALKPKSFKPKRLSLACLMILYPIISLVVALIPSFSALAAPEDTYNDAASIIYYQSLSSCIQTSTISNWTGDSGAGYLNESNANSGNWFRGTTGRTPIAYFLGNTSTSDGYLNCSDGASWIRDAASLSRARV